MRITTDCTNCNHKISIWTWSEDRVRLAMDKGEYLDIRCPQCGSSEPYHVNDFQAEPNRWTLLLALVAVIIATAILLYLIYDILFELVWNNSLYELVGVIGIPAVAYTMILKDDRNRRNAFNRTWIKRE